jgi:ATP-dependent Clp protease ATP-binding subunit ClpA
MLKIDQAMDLLDRHHQRQTSLEATHHQELERLRARLQKVTERQEQMKTTAERARVQIANQIERLEIVIAGLESGFPVLSYAEEAYRDELRQLKEHTQAMAAKGAELERKTQRVVPLLRRVSVGGIVRVTGHTRSSWTHSHGGVLTAHVSSTLSFPSGITSNQATCVQG